MNSNWEAIEKHETGNRMLMRLFKLSEIFGGVILKDTSISVDCSIWMFEWYAAKVASSLLELSSFYWLKKAVIIITLYKIILICERCEI